MAVRSRNTTLTFTDGAGRSIDLNIQPEDFVLSPPPAPWERFPGGRSNWEARERWRHQRRRVTRSGSTLRRGWANPAADAAAAMAELGVRTRHPNGQLRGAADVLADCVAAIEREAGDAHATAAMTARVFGSGP